MSEEISKYLPIVADWASVVSLLISAYAAYAITRVRSQIVNRVRLPSLLAAIEKSGKKFAALMLTYEEDETKEAFAVELARCEANLNLVRSKGGRPIAGRIRILLRNIRRYKRPQLFGYYPASNAREDAWRIYSELNGLIEELKNFVEEQRIGA